LSAGCGNSLLSDRNTAPAIQPDPLVAFRAKLWEISVIVWRQMDWRIIRLPLVVCFGIALESNGFCQTAVPQVYTLISGSELTDDCPICDRLPIVVPLRGTFSLRVVDQNPILTRYELLDIDLYTINQSGLEYSVTGTGIYEIGGEVVLRQDMFLAVDISNDFVATKAQCGNTDASVSVPWPELEISVDQTNGTPAKVYRLKLIAVPIPTLSLTFPTPGTGDARLEWQANGGSFQLERAANLDGPYTALKSTTNQTSFIDSGVLTNNSQFFYRLRQM